MERGVVHFLHSGRHASQPYSPTPHRHALDAINRVPTPLPTIRAKNEPHQMERERWSGMMK